MATVEIEDQDESNVYDRETEAFVVYQLQLEIVRQQELWSRVQRVAIDNGVTNAIGEMDRLRAGTDAEIECRQRIGLTLKPIFVACGLPEDQIDWRIQDLINNLTDMSEIRRERDEINYSAWSRREKCSDISSSDRRKADAV